MPSSTDWIGLCAFRGATVALNEKRGDFWTVQHLDREADGGWVTTARHESAPADELVPMNARAAEMLGRKLDLPPEEARAAKVAELEADKAALEHTLARAERGELPDPTAASRALFRLEDVERRLSLLKAGT